MRITRKSFIIVTVCITAALCCAITSLFLTPKVEPINCFCEGEYSLSNQQYDAYDNTTTTGTLVLNAIRKFSDKASFGIQVITGKNNAGSWYGNVIDTIGQHGSATYGMVKEKASGILENAIEASSIEYVDPKASFKSNVIRDNNNDVRGIIFREQ